MKKQYSLIGIFCAMAAVLCMTACGPQKVATLVYGTTDKVTDMDTASAYDIHTWEIFQNCNTGLLAYEPGTTNIVPALATGYTVNAAGDEYTFTLRKGLKFSNGSPINAKAVKWSVDRAAALKGDPSALVTQYVKEVVAVDDLTVKFVLNGPVAFFPALAATPTYFPVDSTVFPVDKIVKDVAELKGGAIPASGPYILSSFKRDEQAVFEVNPKYWGEQPKIKKIIIRYFADATTMRLALEKGEVDLTYKSMNPSDITDLMKNETLTNYPIAGQQIRYLCFETSQSIFKKKELRQAVAALVDRPEVNQKVYLGQNTPLYSMIPQGMIYHADDFKTVYGDANVAKAEELLKKAGYSAKKPFKFDLWYSPSHYGDTEVNMAEVVKAQLEKTPLIKVTLKSAEWATYKSQMNNKQMPSYFLGWYPDFIDPDNYTSPFGQTQGSAGMGIFFSDPEWDALFVKEQTTTDNAARETVFNELQKRWTEDVPTVPIYQGNLYIFSKKNVTGVKIGPTLIFNYNTLSFTK